MRELAIADIGCVNPEPTVQIQVHRVPCLTAPGYLVYRQVNAKIAVVKVNAVEVTQRISSGGRSRAQTKRSPACNVALALCDHRGGNGQEHRPKAPPRQYHHQYPPCL